MLPWLAEHEPDVLCMQETKLCDDAFPHDAFRELGYEVAHCGFNQWNGVAIASRCGLDDVACGFGESFDHRDEGRVITATCGGIRISSVYVPNGRSLDDPHYEWKLHWLGELRNWLNSESESRFPDRVVCGDFNIAPEDRDVWDAERFIGHTHVSEPERQRLAEIIDLGFIDVARHLDHETDELFTWWDYRMGSFHRGWGMRIDLMLVTKPIADRALSLTIDRDARKGEKPSDHAPLTLVLADA